jgi:hypothetical protein
MLLLEPRNDFLERRVVLEHEAIPQRPLCRPVLAFLGRYRFRETEEGQGEVHKPIFEVLEFVLAVNDLIESNRGMVDLERHQRESGLPCITLGRLSQPLGTSW